MAVTSVYPTGTETRLHLTLPNHSVDTNDMV